VALTAEAATPACRDARDEDAIAWADRRDARSNLLDGADRFVAQDSTFGLCLAGPLALATGNIAS